MKPSRCYLHLPFHLRHTMPFGRPLDIPGDAPWANFPFHPRRPSAWRRDTLVTWEALSISACLLSLSTWGWCLQNTGSDTNPGGYDLSALEDKGEFWGSRATVMHKGCTLAFTRRCHCWLKSVKQMWAGGLSTEHEGDSIMELLDTHL